MLRFCEHRLLRRIAIHIAKTNNVLLRRSHNTSLASCTFVQQPHQSCMRINDIIAHYSKNAGDQDKSPKFEKSTESSSSGDDNKNNDDDEKRKRERLLSVLSKAMIWMVTIYGFTFLLSLVLSQNKNRPETKSRYVSWHEFVHYMLATGEVRELIIRPDMDLVTVVLHEGAVIKGRTYNTNVFYMAVADIAKFEQKLRDVETRLGVSEVVSVTYDRNSEVGSKLLITLLFAGALFAIVSRMKGFKSPISFDSINQMTRAKFTLVDPTQKGKGVYFKDVAGLKEVKQEVMEFVDYLKSPEKYQRLGAKVPKGALLLGPPGCGKTLLAKAVATESQVPFLSMNGSEFIEMIGGLGAARVRDLFKEARKRAPCIIYIDEIDAIGRKRSGSGMQQMSSGESEQTLNQLLVEMDGMSSKQGVLMLASTNRADVLDSALLRPGRFDRHILIDLPNLAERSEIFNKHLGSISLSKTPDFYAKRLAILTPGFSGADIANVCNEAALHAARTQQKKVTSKNLEYAVERLVGGTEKRSHAMNALERRIVAYHESGHALVGWLLPWSDVLQKVTIVPRTNLALGFAQYTPSEQQLFTKEQLEDKMCMTLGGRVAESLTFSSITSGAQNDLEKVTKMAHAEISKYGMNDRIGPMFIADPSNQNYSGDKPFSNELESIVDEEVRKLVLAMYIKAESLLKDNQDKLTTLAEALLVRETLNYEDVVELIGPPIYEAARRKVDSTEFEESIKSLSKE